MISVARQAQLRHRAPLPTRLRSATLRPALLSVAWATIAVSTGAAASWSSGPAEPAMQARRSQHGSALLDDGSLLVTLGVNQDGFVQTAERYDAGTWASAGIPGITGNVILAQRLGTGQVLVHSDGGTSAALYDPRHGSWSATGALGATGRTSATMTLLPDGRVLLAGGGTLRSAELYEPTTNTWQPTSSMADTRRSHGAVLLHNGQVLVVSGFATGTGNVSGAERFDPATGTWHGVASPLIPRYHATLTLLPDGRVLLAGGMTASTIAIRHAEIYDPIHNTWTATGTMAHARNGHTAVLLPNGLVLVTGGADGAGNAQTEAELYDPANGTWSSAGTAAQAGEKSSATLMPHGEVLLAGGHATAPSTSFSAATQRYTPVMPPGVAPTVAPLSLLQRHQAAWHLSGSGFTGASQQTPTLELRRVDNGALTRLAPASHSDTHFESMPLPALPAGLYMARIVVDGLGSPAQLVQFTDAPGTPTVVAGHGDVQVQWTAPALTGGNPVGSYSVSSVPASAGCTAVVPNLACTVPGLDPAQSYRFTVNATHANGVGPASTPSAAVTPLPPGHSAPLPGGGTLQASISGGGAGCALVSGALSVTATPPSWTAPPPAHLRFPNGVVQLRASGCTTDASLSVTITYPQALPSGTEFWKYGPPSRGAAATWFALSGTSLSLDGRRVTYTVQDNGRGDNDPANGVVFDPFAPALSTGAGGITAVPSLSPISLALLSGLMAGLLAWRSRRR